MSLNNTSERDDFALVPRSPRALEKTEPGAKRILSGMVADTLALAHVEEAEAAFNRGSDYYSGNGVPIDYTMAAKCFREAAEKGHAAAQCRLGFCYEFGKGVTADDGEAVRWYRMGAEQGYAQAQFYFGFCYTSGHGVTQDDVESVKWIRMAAEQGLAEAQQWLGICHNNGTCGFPQDYAESVKWFRKAAEQGDAHSQYCLGRCYLSGMGVVMDRVEAFKWFRLADSSEEVASTKALLLPEEFQEAERRIRDFKAVQLVQKVQRPKLRIVVVEDESVILQFIESFIRDWFKDVTLLLFSNSNEAWQELSQTDPDLLITRDKMPNLTGEEIVRRLMDRKVIYPIIVDGGWPPTEQWVRELANRGLNVSFLLSPFDVASLRNLVKACLKTRCDWTEKLGEILPHPRKSRPLRIIMVCSEPAPFQSLEFVIRLWFKDATFRLFQDNGEEAWQELSRTDPDLLIMADAMPVLRGEEIGRRLLDRKATYPIIVTSAFDPTEDWVREFASRGLNVRFLVMPFTIEDVRKLLEASLKIPLDKNHEP